MNDLSPLSGQLPAHIVALRAKMNGSNQAALGGISKGSALPKLSIRGKDFRLAWNGQEQNLEARSLPVLIVRARDTMSRRYYDETYQTGSQDQPTCHSSNGAVPDRGTEIQADACNKCPHSVFGSKILPGGREGFACGSYKQLVVTPIFEGMAPKDLKPCSLQLPIASVKRGKGYQGQEQFLYEYLTTLDAHNIPASGVITRLVFTDSEYPQVAFRFDRYATAEEVEAAQVWYEDADVVQVLEGTDEQPTIPKELPPPVQEAVKPPAFLAPAPAKSVTGPKRAPSRPGKAEVSMEATSMQTAPAPETPAAPIPALTPQTSADSMAKVRSLLAGLKTA